MITNIDWLSFTVPVYAGVENPEGFALRVENGFFDMLGQDITNSVFGGKWNERKGGRAPYSNSYDVGDSGIVAFLNPKLNEVLVEFSGQACHYLRKSGFETELLEKAQTRLTRLDLAVDVLTETTPKKFAPEAQYATTKTYSSLSSKTGETVYLGSHHSERYTRVYRYASPHPRAEYLRVEFVFRRKVARAVAQEILVQGAMAVASVYGKRENFIHECWKPTDTGERFATYENTRRDTASTLIWLANSVAPAVKRLIREGVIKDPEQWLTSLFLSD